MARGTLAAASFRSDVAANVRFGAIVLFAGSPTSSRTPRYSGLRFFDSGRRCVVSEDVVTILRRHMAREAGFVQRLVPRFAVREVSESPAAGCGVLFRVFDHELDVHSGPSNERLESRTGKATG